MPKTLLFTQTLISIGCVMFALAAPNHAQAEPTPASPPPPPTASEPLAQPILPAAQPDGVPVTPIPPATAPLVVIPTSTAVSTPTPSAEQATSETPAAAVPFAFGDFTWLNGGSRQVDFPMDGPVLTGMFTVDVGYNYEFSHPRDHSIIASTSAGRSNELQITHLGLGADFHYKGARGRIMTQLGMYATMTPRNDASPARGQWDLADAYRYIAEAYGGYHFDVANGLNIDAGIFLSYVGLCSYYNYENWTDQASYVSSNTPWFFNGIRIQYFPSDKVKIEPWIINGWQAYGMFNEMPGLGLQIAWRPTSDVAAVASGYVGKDALGNKNRTRYHSDDSLLVRYHHSSSSFLSQAALSFTFDAGCETGGGVQCAGGNPSNPTQSFIGAMIYNRLWFDQNKFALTVGGGAMTNPGRYLVLVPPINGANAYTLSPYFTQNPGDKYWAWDTTETFDYLANQFVTLRLEFTHRWASVPYFVGPGGVTPEVSPGVFSNVGAPGSMVDGFKPDLRHNENRVTVNIMVRI